jgi:hypothetical protein
MKLFKPSNTSCPCSWGQPSLGVSPSFKFLDLFVGLRLHTAVKFLAQLETLDRLWGQPFASGVSPSFKFLNLFVGLRLHIRP